MTIPLRSLPWILWPTTILLVLTATYFLWTHEQERRRPRSLPKGDIAQTEKKKQEPTENDDEATNPEPVAVKVLHPRRGAMALTTTQVGSVHAKETVELYSKVTGYLKSQSVDIGSVVKKNDPLAVIDVPELDVQIERNAAVLEQATARVEQIKKKVAIAHADVEAAKAAIVQAEANAKSATAFVAYRAIRYQQMKELAKTNSVEGVLVDEAKERHISAIEAANAATATIATAKANLASATAKIALAEADVIEAQSHVKVAQADLKRSKIDRSYAEIVAPFDGIITYRSLDPKGFVRSASTGGQQPLLTIQRTDRMRVVVQIPDRFVPSADPGDVAYVEFDALREKFTCEVSRCSRTEDAKTRMMHIEIDLPNAEGRIRPGMYGRVTIILDRAANQLSIPTECLTGVKDAVYVVRDGRAHLQKIKVGSDNGVRVEVLSGLGTDDQVVLRPSANLRDGAEVEAALIDDAPARTARP